MDVARSDSANLDRSADVALSIGRHTYTYHEFRVLSQCVGKLSSSRTHPGRGYHDFGESDRTMIL